MNRRRILFIAIAIIAVAILTYLLTQTEFIQETFAPRVYILYVVIRAFFGGLPQIVVWAVFVFIAIQVLLTGVLQNVVTWLKLRGGGKPIENIVAPGAVEKYTLWIEQESQGAFFKWRLRQRVIELGVKIIGRNEPISLGALERSINDNRYNLPEDVLRYLDSGLKAREENRQPQGRSLLPNNRKKRGEHAELEAMLDYMEEALEL